MHRLKQFIEKKGVSLNAFDAAIGAANGYIGKTIKNEGSIGSDVIEKIFSAYPDLDVNWLITGKKTPPKNDITPQAKAEKQPYLNEIYTLPPHSKQANASKIASPTASPTLKKGLKTGIYSTSETELKGENTPVYNLGMPQVITVNERQEENIIYVPVKARAGYLNGYGDPEFIQSLPSYRLPGLTNGTYRMFETEGPSMAPNIISGDKVIGQWVGSLDEIRDNYVYIVVSRNNGVVVKRLLNRLNQRGKIVLKSDTIHHRKEYPTFEIDPSDLLELWFCRIKLSADFSEPSEVYHRLADLEGDMTEVKQILASLQGLIKE